MMDKKANVIAENIKIEKPGREYPARKQPKKITETYLHNAGLHYLQRFSASSGHFRKILMRKIDRSCFCHPDQDREQCIMALDRIMERFQSSGLLDDRSYMNGQIESLRRKGLSRNAIQARLQGKGIATADIDSAFLSLYESSGIDDKDQELASARRLAQRKKIGPYAGNNRQADMRKDFAVLARAGFSYDIARLVLGRNDGDDNAN